MRLCKEIGLCALVLVFGAICFPIFLAALAYCCLYDFFTRARGTFRGPRALLLL